MFSPEAASEVLGSIDNPLTLLEGLFLHSPIGVQLYDRNGHSLFVNKAFVEIFGVAPPSEYCVLRDENAVRDGTQSVIRDAFQGKAGRIPTTWYDLSLLQHVKVDGRGRRAAIETILVPVCGKKGEVQYVVFFIRDVTAEQVLERDRSEALRKLQEANGLIEGLMAGTEAVIYAKDLEGRFLFVNNQYGRVVSKNPAEIIGKLQRDIHPAEVAASMRASDLIALDGRSHYEVEETVTHPDGSKHDYLSLKFPLKDVEGKVYGVCGISTNITKVRGLERELGHARRMESLGILAGGVAHDFNNLLGAILLHTESLARQVPAGAVRDLEQIRGSVERATALVRQLLAFGRRLPMSLGPIDLNAVVRDLSYMVGKLSGEGAELVFELAAGIVPAHADSSRVEQVLVNLCMNARDALVGAGKITLRTGCESVRRGAMDFRLPVSEGDYVFLEVEDNGSGMTREVLERAFDPFFTTKQVGTGSGLGLSTVFGIVQESGGNLKVRTSPGEGCSVRVYFPRSLKAPVAAEKGNEQSKKLSPSKERCVLLVEDEPLLREITARQLRFEGVEVHEAASGVEAKEKLASFPGINVLISDVIMPGKSGPALVKELERDGLLSGIAVLFISGYSSDELAGKGFPPLAMHLLEKPFTTAQLLEKIELLLKQKAGSR